MKNWKPIAVCTALVLVGGFALAQDAGFQPPVNGLNLPVPKGDPSQAQGLYTGNGESLALRANSPPAAAKSRTENMTVEEIAVAIETVRCQRAEVEKWERELMVAAQSKVVAQRERLAKLGVNTDLPAKPDPKQPQGSFGGGALLFGGP